MALTDRQFWLNYWESHRGDVMVPVAESNLFSEVFDASFKNAKIQSTCEIGGFPGTFSVYLKKKYAIHACLVDYVIHTEILKDFLKTNGLEESALQIIEADIFNYEPKEKYDLVFSVGLIEHFENTKEIIGLHLKYMQPGGTLVLLLPNFTGLNGWFQRTFDIEMYNKHVIECMDVKLLHNTCIELGLKNVTAGYLGKFGVWLEKDKKQPAWVLAFKKVVWLVGKILSKIIPVESKMFSPYIVVTAKL